MAKITYTEELGAYGDVAELYVDSLQLQQNKSSETQVTYKDTGEGNDKIVITGSGFSWEGDFMTDGTITGINFTTKLGAAYMTVTGLSLSVDEFNGAYEEDGVDGVAALLLKKSDTINGSDISDAILAGDGGDTVKAGGGADRVYGEAKNDKLYGEAGNDELWGGAGNDRMWGGPGSDHFIFGSGDGKDIVVDFDAKGGGNKQDYVSVYEGDSFTIKRAGDDVVLNFGDGETLTLLDVKKADFTMADVDMLPPL
jgi:Ca2+-binding RTX toxin-like protein